MFDIEKPSDITLRDTGARLMAFEAAFGVTAALFVIFALLYVRSRKAKDDLVRSNIRLTTELEAVKERGHDLPAIVKNLSAEVLKEHTESFKTTTTDPMGKTMEDLRIHIENLANRMQAIARRSIPA